MAYDMSMIIKEDVEHVIKNLVDKETNGRWDYGYWYGYDSNELPIYLKALKDVADALDIEIDTETVLRDRGYVY